MCNHSETHIFSLRNYVLTKDYWSCLGPWIIVVANSYLRSYLFTYSLVRLLTHLQSQLLFFEVEFTVYAFSSIKIFHMTFILSYD